MPTYWLYRLDAHSEIIEPGSNYDCDDDEQAVALAEMFAADGVRVAITREAGHDQTFPPRPLRKG